MSGDGTLPDPSDRDPLDLDPSGGADAQPDPPALDERPVGARVELTPAHEVSAAALNRARSAARAKGLRPGSPGRRSRGWAEQAPDTSGPGPSRRDPALLGDTVSSLVDQWGWRAEISVGGVIGRWPEVVGEQIAEHCQPETFEDGVLVVRTDSTAWATQVRMLVPRLLGRLAEDLGPDVVREVKVLGPAGPGWTKGPRRVPGRGPRDTYG